MRYVLLGDGQSPHLLKWARALAPQVELWAASSRGFATGFDALVPPGRRLALGTRPDFEGGNAALLAGPAAFAAQLRTLVEDRAALSVMGANARTIGRPEAAREVARAILTAIGLPAKEQP